MSVVLKAKAKRKNIFKLSATFLGSQNSKVAESLFPVSKTILRSCNQLTVSYPSTTPETIFKYCIDIAVERAL